MIRRIFLSAAALAMLSAPAFAQDKCQSPVAPKVPDGKTASVAELVQSNKDVVAFIKDSDQYQLCLKAALDDNQKQVKDLDPKHDQGGAIRKGLLAAQKDLSAKGDANQKEKERVGKEYNTAAAAYKAAHR